MEILTNVGALIVVLGVMIFFHEFGHFITAKAFGMRVFIFSFGFGKRLLGFRWGDTDCRISLIPLGGYVKLEGEPDDQLSEDTSGQGDGRDFTARPRWQRILVYLAGPAMNFVLTIGVLTALFMIGTPVDALRYEPPIVGSVEPGSPAEAAGVLAGDRLLRIDDHQPENWEEAQYALLVRPDTRIPLEVERSGRRVQLSVESGSDENGAGVVGVAPLVRVGEVLEGPAGAAGIRPDDAILSIDDSTVRSFRDILEAVTGSEGRPLRFGLLREGRQLELKVTPLDEGQGYRIGIASRMVLRSFSFVPALQAASLRTWEMTWQVFDILGRLFRRQLSAKSMMGPIGIAEVSGDAARAGLEPLALLVAMISLQVGILNLFPMPPLDGGHLAILFGESVLRRDFSMNVKMWVMNAGAAALFLLIGLVLYSDLSKTSLIGRFLP